MKPWIKTSLLIVLALWLLGFLVPLDRSVPTVVPSEDFLATVKPPAEIAVLLKTICYDCHSYETQYPWYARIPPGSFLIYDHIKDGRKHLNFSIWTTYPAKKAAHKLEECVEEVRDGKMPEDTYTWLHADARLTDTQRQALAQWFDGQYQAMQNNIDKAAQPSLQQGQFEEQ